MEEEIDLKDLIKCFWKKKNWIVLVGIICVIGAIIYVKILQTPLYNSTSRFILTNNNLETEADVYSYEKLPDRYFAIANSMNVFEKVIKNLKLDIEDPIEFKEENIVITHSSANFLINISVTSDDAKKSAQIANEIVKVTIEEIKKIYNDDKIQILDYAVENWNPINIKLIGTVIKVVLIGEVITFAFIFIKYVYIDSIRNEEKKDVKK